jgi:FtsZ-binding cell division protein ZapB
MPDMGSPILDRLHEKVQQVSAELTSVRKDHERLTAEADLMREESRRARRVLREHEEMLKERAELQERLEVLLEKLDKLKI